MENKLETEKIRKAIELMKKHNQWRRGGEGPMESPKEIGESTDILIEAANQLIDFREKISSIMPSDYKDWWQNNPAEWPEITRSTIENLKEQIDIFINSQPFQ